MTPHKAEGTGNQAASTRTRVEEEEETDHVDVATTYHTDDEDDEVETNRVDYASTLEKAYTHLDKMLGSDGMKGLTNETKKLVQQQKGLMSSLEGMAPVLQKAQKTLNGLGPLPDMENMMSMMKKFGGNGK